MSFRVSMSKFSLPVADDGCLEDFENTAAFCREYQQQQECMCDTEHMFDCPGSTKDDEVNTLAQQISNEGLVESALNRIANKFEENEVPVSMVSTLYLWVISARSGYGNV